MTIFLKNIGIPKTSFSFGGPGVWTQGLTLAKPVFYHLDHACSPFAFGLFFR
jgi:hypothetical protein